MSKLDEEQRKLADLEFELKITKLYYSDDEQKMAIALSKYRIQLKKVLEMQKGE
jgi:hypothetical protein